MLDLILGAVGVAALIIFVALTATIVRRWLGGKGVLAFEPRNDVPWGLLDILLLLVLFGWAGSLAQIALGGDSPASSADAAVESASENPLERVSYQAVATFAAAAASVVIIAIRCRASLRDFGVVLRKIPVDLRLGCTAFFVLAPPVYGLQILLTQWVESKHPLVERLREDPEPRLVVAGILSAVFVAPLVEEYAFRVLVQGWLEKLSVYQGNPLHLFLGNRSCDSDGPSMAQKHDQLLRHKADAVTEAGESTWLDGVYAPPRAALNAEADSESDWPGSDRLSPAVWPIFVSAALFAGMHIAHGPDWVPLLLLAIGLGYLYRQTHRIVPCIVVHFLLNACSMGLFLLKIYGAGE